MKSDELSLPPSSLPPAEAEATRWQVRRRDGQFSANDEREYRVWLERDPAHRAAAAKVERYWQMMGAIGDDPEIMALTERRARESNRPVRALRLAALAAGLVAAITFGWSLRDTRPVAAPAASVAIAAHTAAPQEQSFRTSIGQRTTVTLADGSVITLDTDSLLRTRESSSERRVELQRGRAYFKVAKHKARPFVVVAAGKSVVATGTEFAVDVDPAAMVVTLVEGGVRVEAPRKILPGNQTVDLHPGQQLTARLDTDSRWRTTRVDVEKEVSWTSGRLHFFNDTLGKAASEMNRYSEKKIIIRDAAAAAQPIVGNFRAGDVDAFVRAVALHGFAQIKLETDDVVVLVSTGKADS